MKKYQVVIITILLVIMAILLANFIGIFLKTILNK
jgi:hypothetical protein